MKLRITLLVSVCLLWLYSEAQTLQITNGIIDASKTDFTKHHSFKLQGEADFYWQQFLTPLHPADELDGQTRFKAPLPGPWTKIKLNETSSLPTQGYGTYRIRIKIPNETCVYGLKLHSIFTAYNLMVNGQTVAKVGQIGNSESTTIPKFKTREIAIPITKQNGVEQQTIDLVFHVSNFQHRRAGLQQAMYFGTMESVIAQTQNSLILNLFIIGIILIIAINHLLMFFIRKNERANLMFGLLCIIMILRNLTTGERIITHWFPNMNWELLVKLDNFSGFATICLFALYFYFQFRADFPKIMFYILTAIGSIITLLVFTTKAYTYGQFRTFFELYILLGGLYITFGVLAPAVYKKRAGSTLSFIGMVLLYSTAINDVLSSMGVIKTAYLASYGLGAFMFIQSFLLTRRSALAIISTERLSNELEAEKSNLVKRIEERTSELTRQAEELEQHRIINETQNWINEGLNHINEIIRQNRDNLSQLSDQVLALLVKQTESTKGAIYFRTSENTLKLIADYGLNKDEKTEQLDTREGLTGKCYSTGQTIYLEDIPKGFFAVSSGLGRSTPKILALIPLINDDIVIGVLELASFKALETKHRTLLEKTSTIIAGHMHSIHLNTETQRLLEKYRDYEEELKQKESEHISALEELEMMREKNNN